MQTLVKMVTKMSLTKHKLLGKNFESSSRTNLSQPQGLLWKTLKNTMMVVFQLESRLYTLICSLVMVSGKDLVLLMEVSDS